MEAGSRSRAADVNFRLDWVIEVDRRISDLHAQCLKLEQEARDVDSQLACDRPFHVRFDYLEDKYRKVEDHVVQQTAATTAINNTYKAKLALHVDKTKLKITPSSQEASCPIFNERFKEVKDQITTV